MYPRLWKAIWNLWRETYVRIQMGESLRETLCTISRNPVFKGPIPLRRHIFAKYYLKSLNKNDSKIEISAGSLTFSHIWNTLLVGPNDLSIGSVLLPWEYQLYRNLKDPDPVLRSRWHVWSTTRSGSDCLRETQQLTAPCVSVGV